MSNQPTYNPLAAQGLEQLKQAPNTMTMADVILSRVYTLEQSQARITAVLAGMKSVDHMQSIIASVGSTVVASEKGPNQADAQQVTGVPENLVTQARANLQNLYGLAA